MPNTNKPDYETILDRIKALIAKRKRMPVDKVKSTDSLKDDLKFKNNGLASLVENIKSSFSEEFGVTVNLEPEDCYSLPKVRDLARKVEASIV